MITQLKPAVLFDSNIYLLIGSDKTALIDAGTGFGSDTVHESVSQLLNGRKLDYVILTHRHYDHVGGLNNVLMKFDCTALAGTEDARPLIDGDSESTLGTSFGGTIPPMDVEYLSDGDIIDLGGHRLRIIDTPGHTIGSICILDVETNSLFSGDTFFFDGVGRCDLPTGSVQDLKNSLNNLMAFEFDSLYPGHGPAVKTGGKKCLNAAIRMLEDS